MFGKISKLSTISVLVDKPLSCSLKKASIAYNSWLTIKTAGAIG